jgi:hypothetical protein
MTAIDVVLVLVGSLTLLATVSSVGLTLGQCHQRLRIIDVSVGAPRLTGVNSTTCLIVRVMNPGSRPIVVQEAGLTLEGGPTNGVRS